MMQYRSVEDQKGLQYVFQVSASVDETALLTAQRGTLIAFRRGKGHSWEVLDNKGTMRFKNLNIKKPMKINTDQATWDELIVSKLSAYKDKGFKNSPTLKISKDPDVDVDLAKVKESQNGDLYVDKTVRCANKSCNKELIGRQFYRYRKSLTGPVIMYPGRFMPNDQEAQRVKAKSKHWFCANCAVKKLGGDQQQVLPGVETPIIEKPTSIIKEIEDMLSPTSTVNAEFARGANWALRKLVAHQAGEPPD